MNREEAQMVAFQLISYAGDAFSSFFKAVEKARNGEFDEADELIKKGESELTNAHNAQTELLAKEAQGKDIEYSIMLVHAQDHLMTTIMYERVAIENSCGEVLQQLINVREDGKKVAKECPIGTLFVIVKKTI